MNLDLKPLDLGPLESLPFFCLPLPWANSIYLKLFFFQLGLETHVSKRAVSPARVRILKQRVLYPADGMWKVRLGDILTSTSFKSLVLVYTAIGTEHSTNVCLDAKGQVLPVSASGSS